MRHGRLHDDNLVHDVMRLMQSDLQHIHLVGEEEHHHDPGRVTPSSAGQSRVAGTLGAAMMVVISTFSECRDGHLTMLVTALVCS